jgi:hypothetical protein
MVAKEAKGVGASAAVAAPAMTVILKILTGRALPAAVAAILAGTPVSPVAINLTGVIALMALRVSPLKA